MVKLGELTLQNSYQVAGTGAGYVPSWTKEITSEENEDNSIWLTEKVGGTDGTTSVNGGINSEKVERNHRPVQQVNIAESVGRYDGGALSRPAHKSFVEGFSTGKADILDYCV